MSKKGASDFLNRFRRGSLSRRDKNSPKTKSLPVAAQNYLLLHPSEQNKKNEEDPHKVGIHHSHFHHLWLSGPSQGLRSFPC